MQPNDNPPIGILMCIEVGLEMAEYTLMDIDEDVFISKYELQIPSKERMAEFLCFPCSNYSLCLCVRLSAFFICKILRKILRLLQFVLCICKNCFVYNYRLFFFEKYLVELTEIHNFATVKMLIAEKRTMIELKKCN